TGGEFAIRPCHLVMKAQDFGYALAQERAVVRPWGEAPDVHTPKIDGRLSFDHPFGEVFSSAARTGDADRVESGSDEEVLEFRRFAKDEVVVRRKAFGT